MYSVSLLPSEYRLHHQLARKKDVYLLFALGVIILLLSVYLILSFSAANISRELENIRDKNTAMLEEMNKLENLEAVNNEVTELLNQASISAGTNPCWVSLIAMIGNSVAESVGLSDLSMKYAGDTGNCLIKGTAVDHQAVSLWMEELQKNSGIGEIQCKSSAASEPQTGGYVQFELDFPLLPGNGYELSKEVSQ